MFDLHSLRHSSAHVLAEAVCTLYPGARLSVGPATETGYFYDVELQDGGTLTEEDLPRIELEMAKIARRNTAFERRVLSRDEALAEFACQPYKLARIAKLDPEEEISVYDQGGFVDLCRGPHVERTGQVEHVKLTKVSGAYLDGDSSKTPMQRIYGVAFPTRKELEAWQEQQEEASRRDHRRLGEQLGLFMTSELSPGAVFWLPNGESIYNTLQQSMRSLLLSEGYVAVQTPVVMDHKLWETSGHLEHYRRNMFHVSSGSEVDEGSEPHRGLKPMNCPCHMVIFGSKTRSYRDLPMRIHDQGVLHRNELSGALGGLTRVRQFCQDDAHIFCSVEQIRDEVVAMIRLVEAVYSAFGLGFEAKLSTRPPDRLGEEELWDQAEVALEGALEKAGLNYVLNEGDGAFYGPKIDFDVKDAIGRSFQCATIQLDFQLPRNFDLRYVDAEGIDQVPVVIHRAIFGSFERFVGILIEHFAGAFPVWLSPEIIRVATITNDSEPYAQEVVDALREAGVRAVLDGSGDRIGKKIRDWREARSPYIAVVGKREQAEESVALRSRDGKEETVSMDELIGRMQEEMKVPFLEGSRNEKEEK